MPEIKIFDALPEEEILAQMAEECVEASKAALKLRRARSGVNPTPVSEKDAFENLVEELADIYLCSIVFFGGELDDNDPCNMCDAVGDRMVEIMEQKLARWKSLSADRTIPRCIVSIFAPNPMSHRPHTYQFNSRSFHQVIGKPGNEVRNAFLDNARFVVEMVPGGHQSFGLLQILLRRIVPSVDDGHYIN